jgi:transposase
MLHVGLDMHKRSSRVVVLDDSGVEQERRTLRHDDRAALTEYLQSLQGKAVVTVEAMRSWYWLVDLLDALAVTRKLAHPAKVRLIAEATVKTDTIDAGTLAQLERTGFLPESYVPPLAVRDCREYLRYRLSLVRLQTVLKNRIHALLDKLGVQHRFTDLFGVAGRRFLAGLELRPVYRAELDNYLALLDDVRGRIAAATRRVKAELVADPRAEQLMTIPGVAHLTAYLLLAEIGDIHRFPSADKLCAYGGLTPSVRQSGEHCWQGHITRSGNRYIRWSMVEAACLAPSKDYRLGEFYRRLRHRRGPLKARVAVARKLLTAVWHVLTYSEPYRTATPVAV